MASQSCMVSAACVEVTSMYVLLSSEWWPVTRHPCTVLVGVWAAASHQPVFSCRAGAPLVASVFNGAASLKCTGPYIAILAASIH